MASGRRDYTWGFLNEAAQEGRYMSPYSQNFSTGVASMVWGVSYIYTIPAGYRFGISRVGIWGGTGLLNVFMISKGVFGVFMIYFNTDHYSEFSDHSTLYFDEGNIMKVSIFNNDLVTTIFKGIVSGTLEKLI